MKSLFSKAVRVEKTAQPSRKIGHILCMCECGCGVPLLVGQRVAYKDKRYFYPGHEFLHRGGQHV